MFPPSDTTANAPMFSTKTMVVLRYVPVAYWPMDRNAAMLTLFWIDNMNGLFPSFEALLDERQQYPVFLVPRIKEGTDVAALLEHRIVQSNGLVTH